MDAATFLQTVSGYAQQSKSSANKPLRLATVDSTYTGAPALPKVTFDGESTLSGKFYPYIFEPAAGDRVALIPVGNTYLIIGALGGSLAGISGDWSVYTPIWTAETSNPSLGNGSLVGAFDTVGETTYLFLRLTAGSTTTFGTGRWIFTTPNVPNFFRQVLPALCIDSSTALDHPAIARTDSVQPGIRSLSVSDGSWVDADTPFTWAEGDTLSISGIYQANG